MKILSILGSAAITVLMFTGMAFFAVAKAEEPVSIDALLQDVRKGRLRDEAEYAQREKAFLARSAEQDALIAAANKRIAELEKQSAELEAVFNANELRVEDKRTQRDERLGSLKELFGHLTAGAGDLRARIDQSISSSQIKGRNAGLEALIKKMNDDTELPTVEEIEGLWYELHREMTETGRVVKYTTTVGTQENREVVRIGAFNLVSNGEYLSYDGATDTTSVLPRQPGAYTTGAARLQQAESGLTPLGIDPTGAAGGGYLRALINNPTLAERWHQGKLVGYVITVVGIIGLLIAIWRFLALAAMASKVQAQRKAPAKDDNPLGRVLQVGEKHANDDIETLEVKLGEAIIKERPEIQKAIPLIKIIAMVAPLMGLLGTVTGMIIVFQAITIYGAGDPKAMAGGISSALVTTVLGLVVAIPMLLCHTLLQGRARSIMQVIEEQTAGLVAERVGR